MIRDEHYLYDSGFELRSSLDRRFWHTSGGFVRAVSFGVVDDYGNIVRSDMRPGDDR